MYIPTKKEVIELLKKGIKRSEEYIQKGLRKPVSTNDLHTILKYVKNQE